MSRFFKKGKKGIKNAAEDLDVDLLISQTIRNISKPKTIQGKFKKLIIPFRVPDPTVIQKELTDKIQKNADDLYAEPNGAKYQELLKKEQVANPNIDTNGSEFKSKLADSKNNYIETKKTTLRDKQNSMSLNKRLQEDRDLLKGEKQNIFIKHWGKGILGATMAGVGITAATTGKSFKEASEMVTDELRDNIIEPTVQVGADSAAVVIEAGVKSSDNLIDATKEGIGGILGAFGFGDGFGLGSSFGTMGIFVFVFMVYYMMIKSTKTTSAGMDLMVH